MIHKKVTIQKVSQFGVHSKLEKSKNISIFATENDNVTEP